MLTKQERTIEQLRQRVATGRTKEILLLNSLIALKAEHKAVLRELERLRKEKVG